MPTREDIPRNTEFADLVRKNQGFAYSLAFRFLGNAADAEDAVQDTFLRVWKHFHEFDPEKKFTTWLYRITANVCLDLIRSGKRKRTSGEVPWRDGHAEIIDPQGDPGRKAEENETLKMVHELAENLPPKQRMAFVLRDLQDLSVEETARIMNISVASVKNNLVHARKFLRAGMSEHYQRGQ
jgi:RNA polymerase sigma-70 factor, ECF subfamily